MRWISLVVGAAFLVALFLLLLPFLLILVLLSLVFGARAPLFQSFRFQHGRRFPFGWNGHAPFPGRGRRDESDAQDIECEVVSSKTESVDPPGK